MSSDWLLVKRGRGKVLWRTTVEKVLRKKNPTNTVLILLWFSSGFWRTSPSLRLVSGPALFSLLPSPVLLMLSHFQALLQLSGAPIDSWSWRQLLRVFHPLRQVVCQTGMLPAEQAGQNRAEPNKNPALSYFSHGKKKRNETLFCISGINKGEFKKKWLLTLCLSLVAAPLPSGRSRLEVRSERVSVITQ